MFRYGSQKIISIVYIVSFKPLKNGFCRFNYKNFFSIWFVSYKKNAWFFSVFSFTECAIFCVKIPFRQIAPSRGEKSIEIELSWLHAPLEDHAIPLLELVGSGNCPPLINHLVNLPLVQVTLDRIQTIPQFVKEFSSAVAGTPVPDSVLCNTFPVPTPIALHGTYDFCSTTERVIGIEKTLVRKL